VDETFPGISFSLSRVLKPADRRLDLLNLKYFATAVRSREFEGLKASAQFALAYNNGYVAVFENKSVLPRAFAVQAGGVRVLSTLESQIEQLRDPTFDPQKTVIVSKSYALPTDPAERSFTSDVKIVASGLNDRLIHTQSSDASVLVISQTYYPGWQATVDGIAAEVFPVDVALTGVAVPAGVHDVRLIFRPMSVKIGAVLTIAAAVFLLLCLFKTLNKSVIVAPLSW